MSTKPMTLDEAAKTLRVAAKHDHPEPPAEAIRVVLAELARRDTTIAAIRQFHVRSSDGYCCCDSEWWPCPTIRALSAPVEAGTTEPAPSTVTLDDLCMTPEQILDGVHDEPTARARLAQMATEYTSYADHGFVPVPVGWLRALSEAGAPAEPDGICAHLLDAGGAVVYICKREPHGRATRDDPHDDGDGTQWWDGKTHTIRPAVAPAEATGDTEQDAPDA